MTDLRIATTEDWSYIDHLRKQNGAALGFIPKDAYLSCLSGIPVDGRNRARYQRLWMTEDNGDRTGYIYASFNASPAEIVQVVIQDDARRWERATLLVGQVEAQAIRLQIPVVRARVAADIDATMFWAAMGYTISGETVSTFLNHQPSKSGRRILVYTKAVGKQLF